MKIFTNDTYMYMYLLLIPACLHCSVVMVDWLAQTQCYKTLTQESYLCANSDFKKFIVFSVCIDKRMIQPLSVLAMVLLGKKCRANLCGFLVHMQIEIHTLRKTTKDLGIFTLSDSSYLNSVTSLNLIHPSVPMVAGANSSGKAFLWKEKQ